MSGLLRSQTGTIEFLGQNIMHMPADKLVAAGLAHVPEGRRVFAQMSVEENLEMGAFTRPNSEIAPGLEQIFDIVRELHAAGTTILLVEQNAQMALSIASRAYVMETGKITLSGTGDELLHNDEVRKAYLGG